MGDRATCLLLLLLLSEMQDRVTREEVGGRKLKWKQENFEGEFGRRHEIRDKI